MSDFDESEMDNTLEYDFEKSQCEEPEISYNHSSNEKSNTESMMKSDST